MNRVVITGAGVTTPTGSGCGLFWSNLTAGISGIGPITHFDAAAFPVRIGGQVRDMDQPGIERDFPQVANCRDRKVYMALAAAQQAIVDAGLENTELYNALLHIGMGLEVFWLDDLTRYAGDQDLGRLMTTDLIRQMAGCMLQTPLDTAGAILGKKYGFQAGKFTNCSACAAGAQVIGQAWKALRCGAASVALAGAADSMLNPLGLGGFSLLRVLSDENDQPQRACRPFDTSRQGTVLGEGAGFVVLETLENARRRNARIYAEIVGYGSSLDAFRVSDPDNDGHGAVRSMTAALAIANLTPQDIDCVNAHGTGTVKNDIVETAAIKEVLGNHAYEIPVHSVKSMTGHMIAASGAVEAVAAALTIKNNCVPPTINLTKADDQCDLDYVPNVARDFSGDTVLSNSFGFGGQNATLIFRRFNDGL